CLQEKKWFGLPQVPQDALHNGHIFYIETENSKERKRIINILKLNNIQAYSHYLSLSESPFCEEKMILQNSRKWQNRLLRLPLYYDLSHNDIDIIMQSLSEY
ncbi:MAG: DegT/DnrJ/EryC1/StrS family aminotransferase, partial [Saprospiraceae bacterium]|nr:DegT/DnrJ/EryC1/StrS family aminotransferase [Saprospiraceae bacterium]